MHTGEIQSQMIVKYLLKVLVLLTLEGRLQETSKISNHIYSYRLFISYL
jgi:hypothetical protein